MKPRVIAVVGPTASGKTSLGIYLAEKLGGEVISADSRQVYKGLDIGTGKVTKREMKGVAHHLLDVASPKKQFTADDFVKKASRALVMIFHNKKIPIIVGGTGFYIDALLGRMTLPNVPPNPALRTKLEKKSTAELYAMLKKRDPRRGAGIEPGHKRRIIRALEIAEVLGKSPPLRTEERYDTLWLGLYPGEATLRKNIRARLSARLKAGMLKEAKRLHTVGLSYKRMEELGLEYRYMAAHLKGAFDRDEFEELLGRAIGRYAKRQMRWFKRNKDIVWVSGKAEALKEAKKFLNRR